MAARRPQLTAGETLSDLPRPVTVGDRRLLVDYLRTGEQEEMWAVIRGAARHGYNVGEDEYDNTDFIDFVMQIAEVFTVKAAAPSDGNASILAVLFVHYSFYSRGWPSAYSYFSIILSPQLYQTIPNVYGHLADVCVDLCRDVYPDNVGVSTSVFTLHADWLVQLCDQGFNISACIPFAGILKSKPDVDSYLLSKPFKSTLNFNCDEKVKRAEKFVKAYVEDIQSYPDIPPIPNMPRRASFPQKNLSTVWRNATAADCHLVWGQIQESMREGQGYSLDDFPCYESFLFLYSSQYGVIIEEEFSREFICYVGIAELWPPRRKVNKLSSTWIIIDKRYRNKGLYQLFLPYLDHIGNDIGFRGVLAETLLVNEAMHEGQRKVGFIRVGVIPAAGILKDRGLSDSVLSYREVDRQLMDEHKFELINSSKL